MKFIRKNVFDDRKIISLLLLLSLSIILLPILFVSLNAITPNSSYLRLIIEKGILNNYAINTFELIVKVGLLSAAIGFISAYLITMYEFKFKKLINLLIILPLSIPIYVGAYTYAGIYMDYPILELLFKNDFFMNGAIFIYVIFLYPYVYLASRSYLKKHMTEYIEAAKTLGSNNWNIFLKIIVPLSRTVIIGSVLFVLFETLSDFAVVDFYGIETLSKVINDSWHNLGEKDTAAKLSIYMLTILFFLIYMERLSRGKRRNISKVSREFKTVEVGLISKFAIYLFYGIVSTLGFLLPMKYLLNYAIHNLDKIHNMNLLVIVFNTLKVTFIVIIIIIGIAIFLSSAIRLLRGKKKEISSTLSVIGYSIPSTVLALGVYTLLVKFDIKIFPYLKTLGFNRYLFTGTSLALIVGLSIKFLSIAFMNFSTTLEKVNNSIFEASLTLSKNLSQTFLKVNFPLLKTSIKYASLLLFIDLIKELTITYSLRPFNFRSLSTEVYRYAGNEMLEVSSIPALMIVGLSICAILYLEGGLKNVRIKKR